MGTASTEYFSKKDVSVGSSVLNLRCYRNTGNFLFHSILSCLQESLMSGAAGDRQRGGVIFGS